MCSSCFSFQSIRPAVLSAASIFVIISSLCFSDRKAIDSSAPHTGQISVLLSDLDMAGGQL